jgi:peroxiredoxin
MASEPRTGRPGRAGPGALALALVLAVGGGAAGAWLAARSSPWAAGAPGEGSALFPSAPPPLPLTTRGMMAPGAPAPDFSVRALDGRRITLRDVRGSPTLLFFMASWCGSCLAEAEALGRIHDELAGRELRIIAVDVDPTSSPELVRQFAEAAGGPRYVFALDEDGRTARTFGVATLDTTIIIDREGRIAYRDAVVTDEETLLRAISQVLR